MAKSGEPKMVTYLMETGPLKPVFFSVTVCVPTPPEGTKK
jgi:hypothetical protein